MLIGEHVNQYPSNSNKASSEISYLVGHHPDPVGSPADLCPRHLLCTDHVLLPDTETMMLQQDALRGQCV